ncbi:MAG: restriction endonuclease subunit S [Planctomycetes bacterium]|nr:restriction endonuclease subunit S [Planctomycetota bacterium]
MIAGLKPYPAMKESGVASIGFVPEHWELRKLGRIGSLLKGSGGNKDDEVDTGVPCVRYGDLYTTHTYFIRQSRSYVSRERAEVYTPIHFGDVLFAASGETIDDIGKSAVNLMTTDACCGGDVIVFRPKHRLDACFLGYATDCRPAAIQKAMKGRGITVKHVYGDQLKELVLALPPLSEQAAIVRFLDYVDRRIRRYIRAKQKLIKLLEEQKQAIIHRAVTRGLDPNVRLKPSGVEWLGEVPEHWEVSRVKREFACLNHRRVPLSGTERGAMLSRQYDYYGASGVIDRVDSHLFDDELLLIAEDGANLVLRNLPLAIIANGKFWVNNHAHVLRPTRGNIVYLASVMEMLDYLPWISGAAQPKLTQDRLLGIAIVVPPRPEQDRIVVALESETRWLRVAGDRARREIDLLREYRTRLIADVVTGKLDVREVAAHLPIESEESEAVDEPETDSSTERIDGADADETLEEAEA